MGRIGEILHGEIKESREFSSRNFGLPMGSDWVEMSRDVLEDDQVCICLMIDLLKQAFSRDEMQKVLKETAEAKNGPAQAVRAAPMLHEGTLQFLYWGVQVGRKLEREETVALQALAEGRSGGA